MHTLGPSWLDPEALLASLGDAALWGTALILFLECGLFVFFLPGDSLLFTVGLLVGRGSIDQPLWLVCVVLTIAAMAGNIAGYEIGRKMGPALFSRPDSRFFKQRFIDQTVAFFDKHGPRAIVLARFVPIVRTFITVTAGVGRMDRRRFLTFSFVGALLWATGLTVVGYFLGSIDFIAKNLEVIALLIVAVSVLPAVIEVMRARRGERNPDYDEPAERQRVLDEDVTG
jgi:membrane-associated protein